MARGLGILQKTILAALEPAPFHGNVMDWAARLYDTELTEVSHRQRNRVSRSLCALQRRGFVSAGVGDTTNCARRYWSLVPQPEPGDRHRRPGDAGSLQNVGIGGV